MTRIVTHERGSWRYQEAYSVAEYWPYITRDGRLVWRSCGARGKYSRPQLRRLGLDTLPHGSLHHRPIVVRVRS